MTEQRASPGRDKFPMRFQAAAIQETCLVISWLGWNSIAVLNMYRVVRERHFRSLQLQGSILNLDEVLTMSAHMAAATLVRQDRRAEARDLLSSREYEAQKRIYSLGISRVADRLRKNADDMLRFQQRKAVISIFAVGAGWVALLIGWLVAFRRMQSWRSRLAENNRLLVVTRHSARERWRPFAGAKARILLAKDKYVSKPVSPQALAEVLARWLPKKNDESGLKPQETPPPVLEPISAVVFDRAGMLERLMNDADLARVVTETFLDDIPRQIEALRGFLDAWDAPGAERQAHSIRGASSNVGGEALRALAFEMEKAGKAGDLGAVRARMDDLERGFARLKEAMTKEP
jgi:HPt (histidine-containing phosphotransfer) domain-containing protein